MTYRKDALPLNEFMLFRGFDAPLIHQIVHGGVAVSTPHRKALFQAGDSATHFALVLQGAYKLVRHDVSGHESIVYFAGAGDSVGGLVMMNPKATYPVSCIAIGPSMALKIPRETYVRTWATNALLLQRLNQALYHRMTLIQGDKIQQRLPLAVRVATLLVTLLERYSSGSENVLPIPVTRQEIADAVGSTVESIIRLLAEWANEGILKTEGRQIEVLRLDRLMSLSQPE